MNEKSEVMPIDQHPYVQGLAQIARNAVDRVSELEQASARDNIALKQLLAQRDALLERADTLQRWYDQQLDSLAAIEAQRDALLEAVQGIVDFVDGPAEAKRPDVFFLRISKARAAIKMAEEEGWVAAAREAQKHFNEELKRYEGEKE